MQPLSALDIAHIVGSASKPADVVVQGVSTDSRVCGAEDVFIALSGEKFDGHTFVQEVLAKGCPLAIVSHVVENADPNKQIVVTDTLEAYGKLGAYNRTLYKGVVIGLTGSAGKTTTKEELKFILSKFGKVYATKGNHNNFVGVPESLCNLDMSADYAIIEMGMSAKGEIARLVSYVRPDVAIVTNVYPMHIEFFENLEGIARAKAEIFGGLQKGGAAVINADTSYADVLENLARAQTNRIYKFGQNEPVGADFQTAEKVAQFEMNARCVLKTIEALGLDVSQAAPYIQDFGALDGRGKQHRLALPKGGFYTLIDDSYSGQPESMKLAIQGLAAMKVKGRKIAVLGKMAELGAHSETAHQEIGQVVAAANLDIVIGVCPEMKVMLAALPPETKPYYFENKNGLAAFLTGTLLQEGDVVLIKGAHYSSKLFEVAETLIKEGKTK